MGVLTGFHHENDIYYHNLTGVHLDYRGRGLALAVNIKAIDYVTKRGGTRVRTDNDSTNARMLAVNQRIGFKSRPGVFRLVKAL